MKTFENVLCAIAAISFMIGLIIGNIWLLGLAGLIGFITTNEENELKEI